MTRRVDVAIVGGGHNALTAAAYLASAGRSVVVLERLGAFGGAAVSADAFPGVSARLSRYSYLVSLLPRRIIDELGLDVRLARRRYSSYTPDPGTERGLLVDTGDPAATAASFTGLGATADATASRTGSLRPCRSAKRPAGNARNTCISANSASSTPTATALWPWRSASRGVAIRSPDMQA